MSKPAIKTNEEILQRIRKDIENSYEYFKDVNKLYHEFRYFVYVSSISEQERAFLKSTNKPVLEFNVLNSMISRLLGEFDQHSPMPIVKLDEYSFGKSDPTMIDAIDGHIRYLMHEVKTYYAADIMKDLLSGGFGVWKVFTEYRNNFNFEQLIKVVRISDPTMCAFDPNAQLPTKADGNYCTEFFCISEDDKEKYNLKDDDFERGTQSIGGFKWSNNTRKKKIIILADHYEKEIVKHTLYYLEDHNTMPKEEYERRIEELKLRYHPDDIATMIPKVLAEREAEDVRIIRTRLTENKIIERIITEYKSLPLVYVSGNSTKCRKDGGDLKEYAKPYAYDAKDAQRTKNHLGQTFFSEVLNMVRHKFIASAEAIAGHEDAYRDVQHPSVIRYNEFSKDDKTVRLTPPSDIRPVPPAPEIINGFLGIDKTVQNILGSYDAEIGLADNVLSGAALREAKTHSNGASMPYFMGNIMGLNGVFKVVKELIPICYITPMTLPVINRKGEKDFFRINDNTYGNLRLNYDPDLLHIQIVAGLNFEAQRANDMALIQALIGSNLPLLTEFFNTPEGASILIDNITTIKGGDRIKAAWDNFEKRKKEQAKLPAPPDPVAAQISLEQEHLELLKQQEKTHTAIKTAQIEIEAYAKETERLKILMDEQQKDKKNILDMDKHQSERARTMAELALKSVNL